MRSIDIHNWPRQYELAIRKLEESELSERDKEVIKKFDKNGVMEGLAVATKVSNIKRLLWFCERYLPVDLEKATIQDLRDAIFRLEKTSLSFITKQGFKSTLKKFYKWLRYGDNYKARLGYPKICSWIRASVRKKDQRIIKASDLLTEEEIKKLIDIADHPRDKAFISTLYELGARISEHSNRSINDVMRDEYGYLFDLDGKTGRRTPRIVMSAPYLTTWLNTHPLRKDPNAPLWIARVGPTRWEHLKYESIRHLLRQLLDKAGIEKRVYPHLFRHSRATHCLANGWMNEAQAKVYFGWTPDSVMLSRYAHLTSADANNAVLKMSGIEIGKRKESVLKPKQCLNCKAINQLDALFCNRCTNILDVKSATKVDETRQKTDDIMTEILSKNPKVVEQLVEILSKMELDKTLIEN